MPRRGLRDHAKGTLWRAVHGPADHGRGVLLVPVVRVALLFQRVRRGQGVCATAQK